MILRIYNGGVLEVFWRQPGANSWSRESAQRFLSGFRRDRERLRGLREFLSQREMPAAVRKMSDDHLVQRAAALVSTKQVLVAQYRFTERWPGTGVVLGSRHDSVLLLWDQNLNLTKDTTHAIKWLQRIGEVINQLSTPEGKDRKDGKKLEHELNDHRRELQQLRTIARIVLGVPDYSTLQDPGFLQQIQRLLLAGDLIPIYHPPTGHVDSVAGSQPVEAPAPQHSTPDREEVEDPVTFAPDHQAALQAGALIEAAENGIPFCEICARAAREAA